MRHLFKALLIIGIGFWANSGLASIHLTNRSPGTFLEVNSPRDLDCGSLLKDGSGAYVINVNLTNSGDTIIHEGVLGFFGSYTKLQNVVGMNDGNTPLGGTVFVGNDAVLDAVSIQADTLSIGGCLTGYIASSDVVPEPTTIIIWSLLGGLGLVFAWRKRKSA